MELEKLIKEVKKCYDKKQQDFYADLPAEWGMDILRYLEELKESRKNG